MAVGKTLSRKKTMAGVVRETSMLDRVLTTTDLTALGVGSTIGVGVYVLPGALSKYVAGPAVVLSFFFAAVASVFAGKYRINGLMSPVPSLYALFFWGRCPYRCTFMLHYECVKHTFCPKLKMCHHAEIRPKSISPLF